ncbi:hypothetical protein [Iamia sp.]|uniref:hypothetical protein n=1 Tax=Iamia sp. TaxID=2722710 RepID=UPI002CEB1AA4|nr:hypothetical protein [Iamia sp.]HXH58447.1 hypothetical protein [Iamia sp.]
MSLSDQLDQDHAPGWKPEPGAKVIGTVTDVTTLDGTYGVYPIVTVDQEGGAGLVAIHGFHTVLKGELARLQPKRGDRIGIIYKGESKNKNDPSKTSHIYRVILESADPAAGPDWAQMGADAAAAPDAPSAGAAPAAPSVAAAAAPATFGDTDDPF